jgi:proteasome lid subunit RPN8/RPN11
MKQKVKQAARQPSLSVDSEVVRRIRQHARSSEKAEICGVLIGHDRDGSVKVEACIQGLNAEEAGAHVTFTQDTWEHIYKVKDKEYPDHRIVGWYHSHPGFGVFLSEHDTFIHNNFFSSPGQVAWVFDPHSDEEGCFGWVGERLERLTQIAVVDGRGGEWAEVSSKPKVETPVAAKKLTKVAIPDDDPLDSSSLQRLVANFFSYMTAIVAGFLLCWFFFPKIAVLPLPVDPLTGQPLPGPALDRLTEYLGHQPEGAVQPSKPQADGAKGEHAQPK